MKTLSRSNTNDLACRLALDDPPPLFLLPLFPGQLPVHLVELDTAPQEWLAVSGIPGVHDADVVRGQRVRQDPHPHAPRDEIGQECRSRLPGDEIGGEDDQLFPDPVRVRFQLRASWYSFSPVS